MLLKALFFNNNDDDDDNKRDNNSSPLKSFSQSLLIQASISITQSVMTNSWKVLSQ